MKYLYEKSFCIWQLQKKTSYCLFGSKKHMLADFFTSAEILKKYSLGSKSNICRIQETLIKKELIEKTGKTVKFADPVFHLWMLKQ